MSNYLNLWNSEDFEETHKSVGCGACVTSKSLFCGFSVLPILFCGIMVLNLIICYTIAVVLDHVDPLFPYVSWLGADFPEGCVFTLMMSLSAILVAFIIYFKFKVVAYCYQGPGYKPTHILNKVSAWIGFVASFLFLMSACFPAVNPYKIYRVHTIASVAAFAVLCVYFIIESVVSFRLIGHITNVTKCVSIVRSIFAALAVIALITTGVTGKLSFEALDGQTIDAKFWKSTEPGYALHLTAAFCEWLIVLITVAFFLTYVMEFKAHSTEVEVECNDRNRESVVEDTPTFII